MMRELEINDWNLGFLELLNQLTPIGNNVNENKFYDVYNEYKKSNSLIMVLVCDNRIIATGKILLERKFHNNFSYMGHIEDVVVDKEFRGAGLGMGIIKYLVEYGLTHGCYKITLNCNENNVNFYTKCGFMKKSNEMVLYK